MLLRKALSLCLITLLVSCSPTSTSSDEKTPERATLLMVTTYGDIEFELYNETPLHRDNFVEKAFAGSFDSLLFHRVIDEFVVQGGDPESKNAAPGEGLGSGGEGLVPAEIHPDLFHKRGAIGAARGWHPDFASSAWQFYIVQSGPVVDSIIDANEERLNGWLGEYHALHAPGNEMWLDSARKVMNAEDLETFVAMYDTLMAIQEQEVDFDPYVIPEEHRAVYRAEGGLPFLDQNYTVFGEVTSGMDVVDSIAAVATDSLDRPIEDVRILRIDVLYAGPENAQSE
ncbi:peptidylprolyl isomerase [Cryomorphaceae bacterium]|nr:peptidylprolyl isomerase [Cryomorphaceae bacterium]